MSEEDLEETQAPEESEQEEVEQTETEVEEEEATASEVEDTEAEEAEEEEPKPKPKGKSAHRRIGELTRIKHEQAQRIKELEAQQAPLEAPKEDDFNEYNDYVAARSKYEARVAYREERAAEKNIQAERERMDQDVQFQEKLLDGRDKYDDFEEVAFAKELPITDSVIEALKETDKPDEVIYYLGKNPDEAARIATMRSPLKQAAALGKLEAKISAPKPKRKTNAPPPIETLKGGTSVKAPEDQSVSFCT